MVHNLLGASAWLSSGELLDFGPVSKLSGCAAGIASFPDGSVNLAHLLIGAEGTLAYAKSLTLQLAELPRTKVLGLVNFPTTRRSPAVCPG